MGVSCYIVQKFIKQHGFRIRTTSEQTKTEYTRKIMSLNHADVSGDKNPRYGIITSEETKQKISNKNKNPSMDTRKKMSIAKQGDKNPCFGRKGVLHPLYGKSPSKETRKLLSESHKGLLVGEKNPNYGKFGELNPFYGRKHTEKTKQLISQKNSNPSKETRKKMSSWPRLSGKNHPLYGKSPSCKCGYGKGSHFTKTDNTIIWLRSSYELRIANILTLLNISWEYEYKSFDLITLSPYHPDFYLPEYDLWWEVKGYMTIIAEQKLLEFKKLYPEKIIKLLHDEDIQVLEYLTNNDMRFNILSIGHSL